MIPPDLVDRLLNLPDLPPHLARAVAQEAAAEITRLRHREIPVQIDWERRLIIDRHGQPWRPQPLQWRMLARLLRSHGRLVARETLISSVYGDRIDGGPASADAMIRILVCKIRHRSPWPIRCVHRSGYVLEGYQP